MARSDPAPLTDPLEGADLRKLAVELLHYARRRATIYGWRLVGDGALADGQQVEDVVNEALISLYDGSRHWDRERTPDVLDHLRSVVNSKLDHLANSYDNRKAEGLRDVGDGTAPPDSSPTPETLVLAKERAEQLARAKNLLLDRIVADEQALAVYEAMEKLGDDKPALLAEHLHMPVTTIYNIKKRIERAWREVVREAASTSSHTGRSP